MPSALQAKSNVGPEQWLPPSNACRYITAWTAIKIRWSMTVDPAGQAALTQQAEACPNETLTVETVDEVPVVPVPVVPEQPVIAPATGPAARRFLTSLASDGWRAPTAARPPPRSSRTPSRPALCRWSPSPPVSPPLTPSSRGPGCRRARRAGAAGRQGGHAPILAELDRLDPASIAILGGARAISDPIAIRLQTCTTGVVSRLAGGNRTQSPRRPGRRSGRRTGRGTAVARRTELHAGRHEARTRPTAAHPAAAM